MRKSQNVGVSAGAGAVALDLPDNERRPRGQDRNGGDRPSAGGAKDLSELERLLKLCRRLGVAEITWGNVSLKLGDLPPPIPRRGAKEAPEDPDPNIDALTGLTHEQLMMLSAPEPPE